MTEENFILGAKDYFYHVFSNACFVSTYNRISCTPLQAQDTFINSLHRMLPHWTPAKSDRIVYTTVEEAQSATVADVEGYLTKLKNDLQIGQDGFPEHVILAGDQQTYSIIKKLQVRHPHRHSWFTAMPGDWHLLKLASEVLRDQLSDGGLKELADKCGYTKAPTQWQDIHLLLVSLHESLLRKACGEFLCKEEHVNVYHGNVFWEWVNTIACNSNMDEISLFWTHTQKMLNAYTGFYFAIRSGNWEFRNSSLKVLTNLFFAYSRDKYKELCINSLVNSNANANRYTGEVRERMDG